MARSHPTTDAARSLPEVRGAGRRPDPGAAATQQQPWTAGVGWGLPGGSEAGKMADEGTK